MCFIYDTIRTLVSRLYGELRCFYFVNCRYGATIGIWLIEHFFLNIKNEVKCLSLINELNSIIYTQAYFLIQHIPDKSECTTSGGKNQSTRRSPYPIHNETPPNRLSRKPALLTPIGNCYFTFGISKFKFLTPLASSNSTFLSLSLLIFRVECVVVSRV